LRRLRALQAGGAYLITFSVLCCPALFGYETGPLAIVLQQRSCSCSPLVSGTETESQVATVIGPRLATLLDIIKFSAKAR
jgi:hypothetical protein